MKNAPTIYTLEGLSDRLRDNTSQVGVDGKYYPCRPMGFYSMGNRIRAAWLVFTGKADAFIWPGDQ